MNSQAPVGSSHAPGLRVPTVGKASSRVSGRFSSAQWTAPKYLPPQALSKLLQREAVPTSQEDAGLQETEKIPGSPD